MPLRFEAEELDTQTVDYLRRARELQGEGMPGVYLTAAEAGIGGAWVPGCGAGCGFALGLFTLIFTWGSANAPPGVALLMTAGFMMGGWLILFGLRALLAKQRSDFLGFFKYVDPLFAYEALGRSVMVTPLEGLRGARVEHNYSNEGAYNGSTVLIKLGDETERLNVKSMARAEQVFAFLEAQCEMRDLAPVDRGYRARAITDLDEDDMLDAVESLSRGEDPPVRVREYRKEDREVDELPEPHQGRTAIRWWRYPALVVAGLLLYLICRPFAAFTHDESMWSEVRNNKRPPYLRGYLRDKYTTRHREEAQRELESFHTRAASNIRSARGGNEELKNGLADVVEALKKTHDHPFILIGFQGKAKVLPGQPPNALSPDRMGTQQKDAATRIGQHIDQAVLGPNRDVAEAAYAPNQTATHILFTYDVQPAADGTRAYTVRWTALLRPDPSQNKGRTVVFAPQRYEPNFDGMNVIQQMYEYLRAQVVAGLPRT